MIGKIIGAAAGAKAAQQTSSIGGPLGAALGAAAPFVLRKMSIPAILAVAAGGYAIKKFTENKDNTENTPTPPKVTPSAT